VDLHTHLEYAVFRGAVDDMPYTAWKMQVQSKGARLERGDWRDSALLGAMETVRSGITTIADITRYDHSLTAAMQAGLGGIIYREVQTMDKTKVAERLQAAEQNG